METNLRDAKVQGYEAGLHGLRQRRSRLVSVEEGLNAGMWTIGLALSGNEIGLPLPEVQVLDRAERERRRPGAYARLHQAGARYVVDSLGEVMPCLDDIEAWIARGERP